MIFSLLFLPNLVVLCSFHICVFAVGLDFDFVIVVSVVVKNLKTLFFNFMVNVRVKASQEKKFFLDHSILLSAFLVFLYFLFVFLFFDFYAFVGLIIDAASRLICWTFKQYSSKLVASVLKVVINLYTFTGDVCPILCALAIDWSSTAGFQ